VRDDGTRGKGRRGSNPNMAVLTSNGVR
jgi:hypothetical protein